MGKKAKENPGESKRGKSIHGKNLRRIGKHLEYAWTCCVGFVGNLDTELDSASLMKGELVTIMVADQQMGIDDDVFCRM